MVTINPKYHDCFITCEEFQAGDVLRMTTTYRQLSPKPSRGRRRLRTVAGVALIGAGLYAYTFFFVLYLLSGAGSNGSSQGAIQEEAYFVYWTISIVSIIGGILLVVIGLRQ